MNGSIHIFSVYKIITILKKICAEERTRTSTRCNPHRILNPARLPVPPPRLYVIIPKKDGCLATSVIYNSDAQPRVTGFASERIDTITYNYRSFNYKLILIAKPLNFLGISILCVIMRILFNVTKILYRYIKLNITIAV